MAAPLSPIRREYVLRAIFVGLCALVVIAQAAAATKLDQRSAARVRTTEIRHHTTLPSRLERELAIARKARSAIRFFQAHRSLLHARGHAVVARKALARAESRLATATRKIGKIRALERARVQRRSDAASPRHAICGVFGDYCRQAIDVAWCESRLRPTAQNGQYLGLFQMGSLARRLFGHGLTAHAQAVAAHKYFVYSGRSWGPWSCKPTAA